MNDINARRTFPALIAKLGFPPHEASCIVPHEAPCIWSAGGLAAGILRRPKETGDKIAGATKRKWCDESRGRISQGRLAGGNPNHAPSNFIFFPPLNYLPANRPKCHQVSNPHPLNYSRVAPFNRPRYSTRRELYNSERRSTGARISSTKPRGEIILVGP